MKNINYIESLDVSAPGLIDPGIIILGKSKQRQGSTHMEFEEDPCIQYKADTNKFLGYVGDLAEYKFKHIPEKWHYNNISPLELLNSNDQAYIGTKLSTLNAISRHAVFTELTKDNHKDPTSLPDSNYDKFKPRYFGTAILEDKTVMLFMVPPGYNTVFVSNGSGVYSREEALSIYGPQLLIQEETDNLYNNIPFSYFPANDAVNVEIPVRLSWQCVNKEEDVNFEVYLSEASNASWPRDPVYSGIANYTIVSGLSNNTKYKWRVDLRREREDEAFYTGETLTFTTRKISMSGGSDYSNSSPLVGNLDIHPIDVGDYTQVEVTVDTIGAQTSSEEDSNTQPSTGRGRGGGNTGIPPTVSIIDSDYSLIINNETGMSVVVNNSDLFTEEYAEADPEYITLYAYEFANSPYTFKKLRERDFFVKMKTSYSWYHKLVIDETSVDSLKNSLKSFLEGTVGSQPRVKKVFDTIVKQELSTRTDGGNTYTTYLAYVYIYLDKSQTNLRGVTKYTKVDETDTYKIFKKVKEYDEKDIRGYQVIKFEWNETLYSAQNGNGSGCCNILTDEGYLTKGPEPNQDDCWYIKDFKEDDNSSSPHGIVGGDGRVWNIDTDGLGENFPIIDRWEELYGFANYYEYIKKASQLEIHLEEGCEDYYKLIKLVISPNEGQVLGFKEITNSTSEITVNVGDIITIGNRNYLLSENLILLETTTTDSVHTLEVGNEVIVGGGYYVLQYLPSTSSIESLNIVNLGYKTSENPLKNLDKYLVRETEFVNKYSTLNSNIVDLTSGSYLSTGIRAEESDSRLDFIKYSYRKNYRKGQSVLMGLPENLDTDIIDINRIIPSMWVEEEGVIRVPESILGDIIYDYNSGLICRITKNDDEDYNIDFEPYTENSLYRYRNEYYLYRSKELIRTGKLGVRTWVSLCNDNKGNFPGMSKSWMSRDGNLSKEDKVWVMIFSKEGRKKVLGTVTRKRVEGVDIEGICLRLMTGYLGKTVILNGVQVSVESMELSYEGVMRDFQDLYLIRQVSKMRGDVLVEERAVADLTNNLIFKDKINYVIV